MKWVILFLTESGFPYEVDLFTGTLAEANKYATEDRRHLNYGRRGYRIVADVEPKEPMDFSI